MAAVEEHAAAVAAVAAVSQSWQLQAMPGARLRWSAPAASPSTNLRGAAASVAASCVVPWRPASQPDRITRKKSERGKVDLTIDFGEGYSTDEK